MAEQTETIEVAAAAAETKSSQNEAMSEEPSKIILRLESEVKSKDEEISTLRARIVALEEELAQSQRYKRESEQIDTLKTKSEDTLTRAKSIIFDQTKVIKNQELQMDALNQQIGSLKDVVAITKDLLEIRNLEVKQLEGRVRCIDERTAAERERHELMHKKLEQMIRHNGELKREYETQLCLFQALRERYDERELAKGVLDDAGQAAAAARADGGRAQEAAAAGTANGGQPQEAAAAGTANGGQPQEAAAAGTANGGQPQEAATGTPDGEQAQELPK